MRTVFYNRLPKSNSDCRTKRRFDTAPFGTVGSPVWASGHKSSRGTPIHVVRGTGKHTSAATGELELSGLLENHLEYLFYCNVAGDVDLRIADDTTISAYFVSTDSVVQFRYRPYAHIPAKRHGNSSFAGCGPLIFELGPSFAECRELIAKLGLGVATNQSFHSRLLRTSRTGFRRSCQGYSPCYAPAQEPRNPV